MIDRVQELAGADMLVALLGLVGSRIQDLKADGEDDEVAILTDLYNRLNDSRQVRRLCYFPGSFCRRMFLMWCGRGSFG